MTSYEAVYLIKEPMDMRQVVSGLPLAEQIPPVTPSYAPAYRLRRDNIEAADEKGAMEEARKTKNDIKDCQTEVRIVSVSTEIGKRVDLDKLIQQFYR